jgi:hypothetical protein
MNAVPRHEFDPNLRIAHAAFEAGRWRESLGLFADLIRAAPERPEAYEGAAHALVACLEREIALGGADSELDGILRELVLQAECSAPSSLLGRALCSRNPAVQKDIIPQAAALLSPVLETLVQRDELNVCAVLVLMILRTCPFPWISQAGISALHRRWLAQFTLEDLKLPYNLLFGRGHQELNRDDLAALFREQPVSDTTSFPLAHLLVFQWVLGYSLFPSAVALRRLIDARLDAGKLDADSRAEARSLLLRQFALESPTPPVSLEKLGFEPSIQGVIERATALAQVRHAASAGRTATPLGDRLFEQRSWQALQSARSLLAAKAPAVFRSRRRLKVAVCISGQLRGYEAAFASWQDTVLAQIDYRLFVHSWCSIGRSGAEPFRHYLPFEGAEFQRKYRELANQVPFEDFRARYPALFRTLAESGRTDERSLAEFYRTPHVRLDDETGEPFRSLSNQQKMHYKIESAFRLAEGCGEDFDLIVRIRPDKEIRLMGFDWSAARDLSARRSAVFTDVAYGHHYGYLGIGDQFATGTPDVMAVYSTTWSTYPVLPANRLFSCPDEFTGHMALAQVCWVHGIDVRRAPIRFGALRDAAPLRHAEILRCLEIDSAGRADTMDRELVEAALRDR